MPWPHVGYRPSYWLVLEGPHFATLFYHMMTSLNGNIFRVIGLLWGESTGQRWISLTWVSYPTIVDTLRPRRNGRHFADDIFKRIFLNGNVWIPITISLKYVPKGLIYNIPALVQIMAWRRSGNKPLSELIMINLRTHICVTWPQWVHACFQTFPANFGAYIMHIDQDLYHSIIDYNKAFIHFHVPSLYILIYSVRE